MALQQKLRTLQKIIAGYQSCLIAFSGGVDSTLLLKIAAAVLPREKVLAVTATSLTYPKQELQAARDTAARLKARHKVIKTDEFKDQGFIENSSQRCYFCKRELFLKLKAIASAEKLKVVLDASNASDAQDFRPGNIAKKEFGVESPLMRAGVSKVEVRKISKRLGLWTWQKPSQACLASRIAYGIKITPDALRRINRAERFLHASGFSQVRVRHYNGLCRIEVLKKDIPRLVSCRNAIVREFKKFGYRYVTLDLQGFRSGSMNLTLS